MEIINAELDFISNPEKRDTDFYSVIGTKVILMRENMTGIDINFLHQVYKEINFTGIPYHYVVMESGMIYLARPRIYRGGPKYSYQNLFKNGICILMEGYDTDIMPDTQMNALTELLTMIVMQDNLLISDIVSQYKMCYGVTTSNYKTLINNVKANVAALDPYRTIGDDDANAVYDKVVAGGCITTFDVLAKYIRIPIAIIAAMNPHVAISNGIIPPGTTLFLPKNRCSGYVNDIVNTSIIDMIYCTIISKIANFKALLKSYGNEVE